MSKKALKVIIYLIIILCIIAINAGSILPWLISNNLLPLEIMVALGLIDLGLMFWISVYLMIQIIDIVTEGYK